MSEITDRLEKQADILFNNLSGWEASTLRRIGSRIGKTGRMSRANVKALNNIAAVKQDMEAITKDLAKVTGYNIAQLQKMYGDVIEAQHLANKPLYDYRGKTFIPFSENRELQAIVRAYAGSTGETMINLAKTKGLCVYRHNGNVISLQRYYTDVLDKAVMQITTGATDFHTAMRDSILELGGSGVRVDYGDGVTRRLDSAVRQSLLWGAKQASVEYNNMIGEELGCDGIEIDWHSNPRPEHEFMQGKQYVLGESRTVNGIHFESADRALERLEDYGCLHFKTPILCGISEPRHSPGELKRLNAKNGTTYDINGKKVSGYEASQMMRRLESAVREQKSTKELARASGDTVVVKKCNAKIKAMRAKYDEISDITGISPESRRMSIKKNAKFTENPLYFSENGGIIKAERNFSQRNMANVGRQSPLYDLSDSEIETLKNDIKSIGANENIFKFNEGDVTSYSDRHDIIFVKRDVLPNLNSFHPRDLMSARAVLAHEYYGHRAHRNTKLFPTSWNDEFRASYSASKNTPNLTDEDRRYLILDALERAKEHGVTIRYNDYIRRIIYG